MQWENPMQQHGRVLSVLEVHASPEAGAVIIIHCHISHRSEFRPDIRNLSNTFIPSTEAGFANHHFFLSEPF